MGKTLTIQPVSRIEGHAKISIHLDDAGNVEDAYLSLVAADDTLERVLLQGRSERLHVKDCRE